jgi:hypothetical protein
MTATIAQLKPITLFIVCMTFIAALAALAASPRPAQAANATVPAAQAVPAAPAAHRASRMEAAPSAVAVVPQPARVPTAPVTPVAKAEHPTGTAPDLPATGTPLTLLAVTGALLAAGTLALRRSGPALRPAAS